VYRGEEREVLQLLLNESGLVSLSRNPPIGPGHKRGRRLAGRARIELRIVCCVPSVLGVGGGRGRDKVKDPTP
jgi:hypothetical protein